MAILDIVVYPARILQQTAAPVEAVDNEVRQLLDDMKATMSNAEGVGLAAPQVNISQRIIVCRLIGEDGVPKELYEMINPEITARAGSITWEEGCLSIPGFRMEIERHEFITCNYLNRNGEAQTIEAGGLLAVVIQHEIDHLDGKLIIDNISSLKREMYLSKLKKGKIAINYKIK